MAAQRPPIDQRLASFTPKITQGIDDRLASFSVGDGRTTVLPPKAKAQASSVPFFPIKEDIPGLEASAMHGVTQGITDIGREPIAKIISGYPGEMVQRGFKAGQDPAGIARSLAMEGPSGPIKRALSEPLPTPNSEYAFPVAPQPRSIMGKLAGMGVEAGAGALAGKGSEMALENLAPHLEDSGVRISQNILRPTGRFAKKGSDIARNALESDVLRSNSENTRAATQGRIDALMGQVDDLAENAPGDKTVNASSGLKRMDALSRWYTKRGDSAAAEKVQTIKKDIIAGENLTRPVYGEKEMGQFLMGPASKQTTPQLSEIDFNKAPRSLRQEAGFFGGGPREITSGSQTGSPEDIVAMRQTGRRGVSISPKETYGLRPETLGISKMEPVLLGEESKDLSIKKTLQLRRDQDALLKTKRIAGGYGAETSSPEIMGRQEFTGGLRKALGQAVPEIGEKNREISKMIDVANVAKKRDSVSSRNNLTDLADAVMMTSPKGWGVLGARKLYQGSKAALARNLYGVGKFGNSSDVKGLTQAGALSQTARKLLDYQN